MPDTDAPQLNIPPNATDVEKAMAYSDYFGIPFIRLEETIPLDTLSIIPFDVCKDFEIIAYEYNQDSQPPVLKIAVGNPARLQKKAPAILSELKKQKGINIELAITTASDLNKILAYYNKLHKESFKPEKKEKDTTNIPVSQQTGWPFVDLKEKHIPYEVLTKFPQEVASKYQMVVFESPREDMINVAAVNPDDPKIKEILDFVRRRNEIAIKVFKTSPQSLEKALKGYLYKPIEKEVPLEKRVKLAKPLSDVSATGVKKEEITQPVIGEVKIKEKKVKEAPIEKTKTPVVAAKPTPEVKLEEVTSAELRQGVGARENVITTSEEATEESEKNLDRLLPQGVTTVEELSEVVKTGFIPKILAAIIYLAVYEKASDIHIESDQKSLRLRYRIDGLLRDILRMPLELQAPIVSRIKILAKLKIDETRIPQDGRFEVKVREGDIDLRVSTLPTIHGEKAVLRILDKQAQILSVEELGVTGRALKILEANIKKPYGIILSTGPTGSGKTTTLYAIINKINRPEINIVTLEDPVEYEMPNVNQCQIKPKIGFGFAEGLRSIVRQDPNIIMVGEIRDSETASMATHAALTGHLVLSTLHTNDTASALPRLINMGVEPFLITSAINCIIAQRLVRKICPKCREEYKIPEITKKEISNYIMQSGNSELSVYKGKELKFFRGRGCNDCKDGYKGRIGVFEILDMTPKIEELAVAYKPATEIKEQAIKEGMLTIKEDGLIKVLKGITTIDEVIRVTAE